MPNFVWRVRDKSGQTVVREITATNSIEAERVLISEGCTQLQLISDEIADVATSAMPKTITVLGEKVTITAQDREKAREKITRGRATFWRLLIETVVQSKALILIVVAYGAFQVYREHFIVAGLILLMLPAWFAFCIWNGLPSIYHRQLHEADDWNRWPEVLRIVERMRRISRYHWIKIPESSLVRHRAKALAGLGDLPRALEEFKKVEGAPDCPSWLHKGFVASIYDVAKQHDKGLEWNRLSLEENPRPTVFLDYAYRLLRFTKNTIAARSALSEAQKSPLAEMTKPHVHRLHGVIAYLENDLPMAKSELETALAISQHTPHTPYRDGFLSVTKAYLACVLARQGNLAEAREKFREAKPYLVATDDERLAECQTLGLN